MTVENRLSAPKRRTRAEVQRLAAESVSSSMRPSEFCRSRGLSYGTLDRNLNKRRWNGKRRSVVPANGRLVPVELATKKSAAERETRCGLVATLSRQPEFFSRSAVSLVTAKGGPSEVE